MKAFKNLLNQARKYRVGLILAHQNLDQFEPGLRATVMASTSTKLVGGLSAKDASIFAREMFCEAEFLQGMRKHKDHTEFACFVRNYTPCPLRLTVQFGQMESRPRIGEAEREAFLEGNRKRFAGGETMSPVHQTSSDTTDYDIEESDLL